jgi:hypothetical protein
MNKRSRLKVLGGVLLALAIVAVIVIRNYMNPPRPEPNQKGYYTGPMINKARTLMVDDNGKVYGPAPAEARQGGAPMPPGSETAGKR